MKNPAAVSLGHLGGKARASSLSKKQRTAHALKMVRAREAKKLTKGVPPKEI